MCFSLSLVQGTVYQKTNAEMEMKKINREEFWEQAKVGEKEGRGWVRMGEVCVCSAETAAEQTPHFTR